MSTSPAPALSAARSIAGTVAELWRYPVKGMQGERVAGLTVAVGGVHGDRHHLVVAAADGKPVTAARDPRMLEAAAVTRDTGIWLRLPTGAEVAADDPRAGDRLSAWLQRDVRLVAAPAPGAYLDDSPVHLVSTATLDADGWDRRRFRPNLVVDLRDGGTEDAWVGEEVSVEDVVLRIVKPTVRCTVVNQAQPGLAAEPDLLPRLRRTRDSRVGVYAEVLRPGPVRVGDPVHLGRPAGDR